MPKNRYSVLVKISCVMWGFRNLTKDAIRTKRMSGRLWYKIRNGRLGLPIDLLNKRNGGRLFYRYISLYSVNYEIPSFVSVLNNIEVLSRRPSAGKRAATRGVNIARDGV